MPTFKYKGRNVEGIELKGVIEGSSTDHVLSQLANRGITPITLTEARKSTELDVMVYLRRRQKVSMDELIMFARQMYTITRSGIPLIRSVRGISGTVYNPRLKDALDDTADRLETGMSLSAAMQPHIDVFGPMFISIIQVGEDSGRLDEAFKQLAEYLERDLGTTRQIKTALRYPSFVLIAFIIAITVVNIWVIPAFAGMFDRLGAELPLPTRMLLGLSSFFVNTWPLLLLLVSGSIYWFKRFVRTEEGAKKWGKLKVTMPIIGDIINRATLSRYARAVSLMLAAGVPVNRAMELSARAVNNDYMAEKIRGIRHGIERGENMLATHTATNMFTPLVLQMIAVGEESGKVDELLSEVGEFYEREVDYDLSTLTAKIEPIMIVMMAAFALILALGIFLPMWSLYSVQA
ncbi:MAG: type II secretion system F family protein [Porticoccaceae bacterium]|nr:type II secretion system F family protein [Pseudomonadales bacterium]MCP5172635.1 type II secretion system F family protein [Pseudomonadales bacterium]MCP5302109.1 type II secretion system F family protein [Pseudomonadales bacterium]